MEQLTGQFSANRTVREYTEKHYVPAASAYGKRAADNGAEGRHISDWRSALDQKWDSLRIGDLKVQTDADQHRFEIEIWLKDVDPKSVRVELYADGINSGGAERLTMNCANPSMDRSSFCLYAVAVSTMRPAKDYTVRVIPCREGVSVPLEAANILWQR
jgi:starch phosphorylase